MTYFLEDIARYLYNRNQGDLRKTLVVFPSRRAKLFFNHFLSGMAPAPLWAPQYLTISDLVQKLSGLQMADPLTLLFRLYKTFRDITSSGETFDNFYYYCEVILADFDDIDKYRVDARALYSNLSDLKAIEDYREYLEDFQIDTILNFWDILVKSRESGEKEQFLSIWEVLAKLYTTFGDSLEKEGLAYEGRMYRKAVDRLKAGTEPEWFENEVVFVGFNALNHCEELLFDTFRNRGRALFFWDFSESYIKSDFHEAGFFLKKYLSRYPQPADFVAGKHTASADQKITTVALPSNISQTKIIDKYLEISGSGSIDSPLKTALILADESLLMPVVNSLPDTVGTINISMGYPVTGTPAFGFITLLTDLHKNRRKNNENNYEFYHRDVFSVLNHPFLSHIPAANELQLFQKESRQKNRVYIKPEEISFQEPVVKSIFKSFPDTLQFGRYLREIIETVAEKMKANSESTVTLKWQMEILFAIHKVLMRFEVLTREPGIEFTFPTLLNLLRKIMEGISVPFEGEPLTGLQVMGILETRTLDFENMIILSMNEGKFPKPAHIPSLIPYSLREGFRLPTIIHQDAIFGYYFYRLLHRARNVVLVYNTRTEGLLKGEPSRFILQLRYERTEPPVHIDMEYEIGTHSRKKIVISKTAQTFDILKKYLVPGGNSILSPSALNTYLDCRLRFYFRYIEEISEPEDISEVIEADIFGRILHRVMLILYQPFYEKKCQAKEIEALRKNKKRIDDAVRQAFAIEYFKKGEVQEKDFHGVNLIIRRVIEQYIEGILAFDQQSAPFTILSTEEKYVTTVKPDHKDIELRIGGYIDRLDKKDGKLRIIDYKTGKRTSGFGSLESLFAREDIRRNSAVFQVFLYSWILSKDKPELPIDPLLYYIRDIFKPGYTPEIVQSENRKKNSIEDFSTFRKEFGERLTQLVDEIFDESVPFSQTSNLEFCKRCVFNEICLRETD